MLFGPSGAGKSFVALDMGLAIARGVPWRNSKVKQGTVCWLAAEAEGSIRNRTLAYEKQHEIDLDDVGFYVLGAGIDLTDRATVEAIAEAAKVHNPVLIVVDTLAAAAGSANENSGEDMNPVLDNCKRMHEITGASVLLIHHSGKDEAKGSRGWSGIKARVDAEIEVRKRPEALLRDVIVTKLRDGEEDARLPFKLVPVPIGADEDGEIITSAFVEHVGEEDSLRQRPTIKKSQGKWHRAIREALLAATDMRLQKEQLYVAMLANVPEDQRSANPDARFREALVQMTQLGEVRLAGDFYEFTAAGAPRNPITSFHSTTYAPPHVNGGF